MNFIKIFIQDIKRALYVQRYRYVIAFLMIVALILIPTNIANSIYQRMPEAGNMDFMDNVFYMLCGCEYIVPEKIKDMQIPVSWMAIQFLCGFITLDYIQSDQKGIGKAILLRTRNKLSWWLSKCLCLICMVVGLYGLLYIVSAIVAGINYRFSGGLHMELLKLVCKFDNTYEYTDIMSIYIMVTPFIVSIGITLLQAGISQYLSPVIGLVAVLSIDVISIFSNSMILWGNWGMILRSSLCLQGGLVMWQGIAAGIIAGIIGIAAGGVRFCKKDIL